MRLEKRKSKKQKTYAQENYKSRPATDNELFSKTCTHYIDVHFSLIQLRRPTCYYQICDHPLHLFCLISSLKLLSSKFSTEKIIYLHTINVKSMLSFISTLVQE